MSDIEVSDEIKNPNPEGADKAPGVSESKTERKPLSESEVKRLMKEHNLVPKQDPYQLRHGNASELMIVCMNSIYTKMEELRRQLVEIAYYTSYLEPESKKEFREHKESENESRGVEDAGSGQ